MRSRATVQSPAAYDVANLSRGKLWKRIQPQTAGEAGAGHIPSDFAPAPGVDERRFGSAFPGDPVAVAKVLDSLQEADIQRVPVTGIAAALRPLVSYGNRTVYVDPINGDDGNDGLATGTPLRTIQEAVNRCPIFLYHVYIIDLVSALSSAPAVGDPVVYDEDVLITNVFTFTRGHSVGSVSHGMQIIGVGVAPEDPAAVRVGSVTAVNVHGLAAVYTQGFQLMRVKPFYESAAALAIFGSGELQAVNHSFDAAVGVAGGSGIRVYGARGSLREINCEGCVHGVWAKRMSHVVATNFSGNTTSHSYRSEEASVIVVGTDSTRPGNTDPATIYQTNGGRITDFSGSLINPARGVLVGLSKSRTDALGFDATQIGRKTKASATNSVAVGVGAEATETANVAVGSAATASGTDASMAVGSSALASGNRSVAVGRGAKAEHNGSVSLGEGAVASAANRVRLGNTSAVAEVQLGYVVDANGGYLQLKSPDGTAYKLTIANGGGVSVAPA